MENETEPITRPLSEKELKKLSNEEFDQYCSKIIKKLCKSVADDLDFYDYPKKLKHVHSQLHQLIFLYILAE